MLPCPDHARQRPIRARLTAHLAQRPQRRKVANARPLSAARRLAEVLAFAPSIFEAARGRGTVNGALRVIGWREWLALPEFGVRAIKAKIDTGARSSALHVVWHERFRRAGGDWVRFAVESAGPGSFAVRCEAIVVDERDVTDSGGHTTRRPFVRTTLELGDDAWPVEINLADRKRMLFPMLLGRTAMAGRLLVDPAQSHVLGPCPIPLE